MSMVLNACVETGVNLASTAEVAAWTFDLERWGFAEQLYRVDPSRVLPTWASWRSARQLAWHITDTECRYYLPSLALPSRARAPDLYAA